MENIYSVRAVARSFPGDPPVRALDGVSIEVHPGEVFGLLGPNGAGKTTLSRTLVGLCRPDSGSVRLGDLDVAGRPDLAARTVAYLPQDEAALAEMPVGLAVETTARMRGLRRAQAREERDSLLAEFDLASDAKRPVRALSGGRRRVASLACALAGERQVLVLDEPTTGLDPQARRAVWQGLQRRRDERGVTVVLVTHNVAEAEAVLDRVALIERGRVIGCDTPGRLKARLGEDLRLELVWRDEPAWQDPTVAALAAQAVVTGRRWTLRLAPEAARRALAELTNGPVLAALDDFTLATPSLEDVYLNLGGALPDLERL
ncbi:MAG: ABC transporter ATP-binding protein [Mycobacteriales bacterium]